MVGSVLGGRFSAGSSQRVTPSLSAHPAGIKWKTLVRSHTGHIWNAEDGPHGVSFLAL